MTTIELELDLEPILQEYTEPSIIEYARSQGICVEYTLEPLHFTGIEAPSDDEIDREFYNLCDAAVTDSIQTLTKERLAISRDGMLFLKSAYSLQEAHTPDPFATDRRRWMLDLKMEPPVLKSDYELDFLNFGSTALPDLRKLQMPSEAISEQNDEGFEWPTKYLDYPAQCGAKAIAEKLVVSKEALVYLQNTVKDSWVSGDDENIMNETLQYRPVSVAVPVGPAC